MSMRKTSYRMFDNHYGSNKNNGNPRSVKKMTEEIPKKPKNVKPQNIQPGELRYSPETKGRFKRGPLDWSLDELIDYRAHGGCPARIPDKDILFKLGRAGVSIQVTADIFNISREKFHSNLDWYESWAAGKSETAARIRTRIIEQALDDNVLNALLYLDKIMSGDTVVENVNLNVRNSTLVEVGTEDLLEVMYKQVDKDPKQ